MTPAEIEAEARRLQNAWDESLSATGDLGVAGLAIAEASLRAREDAERQRDDAQDTVRMLVTGLGDLYRRATGREPHPHPREALEQVAALVPCVAILCDEVRKALDWHASGMRPNHPPELAGCPPSALRAILRMLPKETP